MKVNKLLKLKKQNFFFIELNALSQSKLLSIGNEMEEMIQTYNMNLVNELANRDEFEYEKEIKNKFITLLVNIQEQRRKVLSESKRKNNNAVIKFLNTHETHVNLLLFCFFLN